jgi:hypothetical protein
MKNYRIIAILFTLTLLVGCEDEFVLPSSEPVLTGPSEYSALPGGSLTISVNITDPVGLQSVSMAYPEWSLTETVTLTNGETEYEFMPMLEVPLTAEVGSSHELTVSATNSNDVVKDYTITITLDGDVTPPIITNNTAAGIAFMDDGDDVTLLITVTDDMNIATFSITGSTFSEEISVGSKTYNYSKSLNLLNEGVYEFEIVATDDNGNSANETVTLGAFEIFEKMYLADVETDAELIFDLMGVPMVMDGYEQVDSLGKVFRANYYNAVANTEVRFLPGKETFDLLTLGADGEGNLIVDNTASVSPLTLSEVGYYQVIIDTRNLTYTVETHTPEDIPKDMVVIHGTGGVNVNGEQLEGWNPALAKFLTQDSTNPYHYKGVIELFDASPDGSGTGGSFILGETNTGWAPFWRFDNGSEPEYTVPGGGATYSFGSESYGTYNLTFDTYLNRITMIPAN